MAEQHLTTEQFSGIAKKYALELEKFSLTDHTCIVNVLMRLCERRQAIRLEGIQAPDERKQEGAPHLVRPS